MEKEQNINAQSVAENYKKTIEEMKKSMVPKEDYDFAIQENKRLINELAVQPNVEPTPAPKKVYDIKGLRKKLTSDTTMTNLEYCSTALELREGLMQEGYPDPFLPIGKNINPDANDIAKAQNLADGIRSCIEVSNGNPEIFTRELMRITNESPRRFNRN